METIITDKMVFGGNCIIKNSGKTVFVPFAIPGEKLEIEITSTKKDYDTAKIIKIVEPSPARVNPVCPFYMKCGGCNMMHISEEVQKKLRSGILKDCFERNGIEVPEINVISGSSYNYRARFQLNDGGLSERSSNSTIPIEECKIAEPGINEWLKANPASLRPKGRCHLFSSEKVVSAGGIPGVKFAFSAEQKEQKDNFHELKKKNKNIKQTKKRYSGTQLSMQDIVTVNLLGKNISFDVRGFFQSNLDVLEKSITEICRGLTGTSVLDMYAGCGTFSVFLSDYFKKVTLVEHNRDALVFAEQNLIGKAHESYGLSGEKWAEANKDTYFDAVVIDPPRSGMEKGVRDYLCQSKIPQIRSVSCDPATHARDIAALIKAGYKLERLYLLDFYPNTSHIESLAVLTKEAE
ncbi:MAG: class I SAM-dependent RNA methyltransferase [Treponema sp.]|nr:class I SAM-dependent RNA methyltransferase [Treponema sp.]